MNGSRIAFGLLILLGGAIGQATARDLSSMSGEEVKLLQQRLIDAGCYRGAVDGAPNAALQSAENACPDQAPVLRIETGMHVAQLSAIGVDAQCRIAATGSDDKTVRLWSMPSGKLLRVQRLPIDDGDGGKVSAVAVSPDGRWIAAGLDDAHFRIDGKRGVYLFDAATGANVTRIGAIDDAMAIGLAFSPDGRRLAAATYRGGVRVFDLATGALAMRDQPAPRSSAYGVAWAADGTLFAAGDGGAVTRYAANLRRVGRIKAPRAQQPYSVAVDPSGRRLAVSYADAPAVDLFDARDLRWIGAADVAGVDSGDLAAIAWSADGQRLFGGGKFVEKIDGNVRIPVRSWTSDGRRVRDDLLPAGDAVRNLTPCGDAIAFANFDSGFGLLKPDGAAVILAMNRAPIMEEKVGDAFAASADGAGVVFGLGFGSEQPVAFDVRSGTLDDAPTAHKDFAAPRIDGLPLKNWRFSANPLFAGETIELEQNESSFSLAIRGDLAGFVLGTFAYVRAFDRNGHPLWRKSGPGAAFGVNLAKDGGVILVAYGDGAIRWLRWSDGQELLALFVEAPTRKWVAWTPTGYYMASPGGEDLIGWQVNRGWEQQADFFPASRFRDRFNRPDIVRLVLETLDEGEAVRQANAAARRREDVAPLTAKLPPVIRIDDPPDGGRFSSGAATIGYGLRSPSGLPIDRIDVLVDGRPVKDVGLPLKAGAGERESAGSLQVDLPPRDVEVGLIAWSGEIASDPVRMKLTWTGAPAAADRVRKLHALVVGISDYVDPGMTLAYAAKDARDFAHALELQKGGYYREVETRVIVDRDATRASLIGGLEWLEKQAAGPDDVSVLFLAGHGLTDEKQTYWFLPSDASEEEARAKGVSQDEVRRSLQNLPGKVLWFLDTCHAGGAARRAPVDVNVLVNTVTSAENGGIVAFASSTGREASVESSAWKNGAFTKAIVEGIEQGKADLAKEGTITTSELDFFLAKRVRELTDDQQHPVMGRPPQEPDFTIAQVRKP